MCTMFILLDAIYIAPAPASVNRLWASGLKPISTFSAKSMSSLFVYFFSDGKPPSSWQPLWVSMNFFHIWAMPVFLSVCVTVPLVFTVNVNYQFFSKTKPLNFVRLSYKFPGIASESTLLFVSFQVIHCPCVVWTAIHCSFIF